MFDVIRALLIALVFLVGSLKAESYNLVIDEAALLQDAIQQIERNHLRPPSRLELANRLRQLAWEAAGEKPESDGKLTEVEARSERRFRSWLENLLFKTHQDEYENALQLREKLVATLSGRCQLVRAKDYHVQEQIAGSRYVGVGIRLGERKGRPVVSQLIEGGPLDLAGGANGDEIHFVDGNDVRNASVRDTVDLLRGPEGSLVDLHLARRGQPGLIHLQVQRGVVPIRAMGDEKIIEGEGTHVAYVDVKLLQASLVPELRALQQKLTGQRVRGLILDLRGVGGDDAHQARILLDALIPGGDFGYLVRRSGSQRLVAGEDALFPGMALAAMVDENTVGPMEWVAASLREHRGAILAGDRTAGFPFSHHGTELIGGDTVLIQPEAMLATQLPRDTSAPLRPEAVQPEISLGKEVKKEILKGGYSIDEILLQETVYALRKRIWSGFANGI